MVKKRERAIDIPEGVKTTVKDNTVIIEGPKGKLERKVPSSLKVGIIEKQIFLKRQKLLKNFQRCYTGR